MWELPFVRKADDLALATSHLAQSSSASRTSYLDESEPRRASGSLGGVPMLGRGKRQQSPSTVVFLHANCLEFWCGSKLCSEMPVKRKDSETPWAQEERWRRSQSSPTQAASTTTAWAVTTGSVRPLRSPEKSRNPALNMIRRHWVSVHDGSVFI